MNRSRMHQTVCGAIAATLLFAGPAAAQGSMGGSSMPKKDAMAMDQMHQDNGMNDAGMFQGASGHAVQGHMTLAMKDGHAMIHLGPDFKLDGNKNIDVVLSDDMMYSAASARMVGKLGKAAGAQDYALPSGTMTDHYHYALLRDRSTGTVVGMAKLPAMSMMGNDGMGKKDGMMKRDTGMVKQPGGRP